MDTQYYLFWRLSFDAYNVWDSQSNLLPFKAIPFNTNHLGSSGLHAKDSFCLIFVRHINENTTILPFNWSMVAGISF